MKLFWVEGGHFSSFEPMHGLLTINRPDDTIKLAGCEIGSSSRVTFDLVADGPFTARLQQSERGEFSVTPERGELDPVNGTTFSVDYAPVEYGRQCRARLIINTPQRAVSVMNQTWLSRLTHAPRA